MAARMPVAVALCVGCLLPGAVAAQGLGDAAQREKARRSEAKPKQPAKVYDNEAILDDGHARKGTYSTPEAGDTPGPVVESSGGPIPVAIRGSEPSASPAASSGGGEAYWRGRAQAARAAVAAAEKSVADAEAEEARHGPYTPGQTAAPCADGAKYDPKLTAIEMRERAKNTVTCSRKLLSIREGQEAHADLESARQSLAAARQAVDDLQEEARKAGALPGWVR